MRKTLSLAIALVLLFAEWTTAQNGNPIHGRRNTDGSLINVPGGGGGEPENSTGTSGTGANIDVLYHKINWRVNPDSATKYIKGTVQTNFKTIVAGVTTITFDLNAVHTVNSVFFRGANLPGANITRSGNILTINLGVTLANNFIDSVVINYQGAPPAANIPPGAVGYQKTTDAGAGNYIYTLSESYEDRDWWPCKHDMQDKIDSMDITVSVPWGTPTAADTFWVACNGKMTDSTISGNSRYFTFKTRYPIASYLVSLGVAKFSRYYRTVNVNGTAVPVVYNLFKGKSAGTYTNMLTMLDSMNLTLAAFSNKLSDYPFKNEKHGFYEFGFSGGMEHQTFSGISTGSMTSATILAHELMHQWFGDNVTFGNWNDLWLAEGFAAYGELQLYYELVAHHPATAYYLMKGKKTTALSETSSTWIPDASCNTSALWNSAYGSTVYDRGCMVVSMLRAISGDAKFFQALTNYQTNRAKNSATTDTLKNYFNAVCGQDLTPFFNDYVGGSGKGTTAVGGIGNPINPVNWNTPATNKLVIQMGTQTKSATNNVTYFRGPVVLHFTNAASGWTKDTTIVFFDWGGGNLSYAGNGVSDPIAGNILNYDLSFTPTNAFYDDSAKTMSTGSVTKVGTLTGYTWTGATNSTWGTTTNWTGGTVAPSGAQVTVATTGSQPVLPGTITVGGLFLNAGTKLTIGNNTLIVNGPISGTGTITGSATSSITINDAAGTINMDQTSAATRSLNNLSISGGGSATLGTALDVYGTIGLTAIASLNLNGKAVTLKSNASGTASIGDITGSTLTGATNVTVERFIPANANRAWRLLSAPTTGQTIKQAWQEGAAAGATTPAGNGIQITSSSASWAANGFDFQSNGNSMKTYDQATDTWVGVTSTANAIATNKGYVVFIRGDRTALPSNATITATTLRTTGTIYQGTQTAISIPANKYELVGNIYPSAIDFRNITRTGSTDPVFYVWDPKLTGAYGLGAYQTCTLSGANYLITPGGGSYGANGSVNNTIQSGQAFFVHTTGGTGTVQLTEGCKTSGSAVVFLNTTGPGAQFVTNLYAVTGTGNELADGVLSLFDTGNSNAVDGSDAQKLSNIGENIGISRDGNILAAELRQPIALTDTLYLNMTGLKKQDYQFEFIASDFNHPGLKGKLVDNYLGTSTPVNTNGNTIVNFTINNDAASSDPARFKVVFFTGGTLPVTFTSVKAYQQNTNNIAVEWKVSNQVNIRKYEVERATDGFSFNKVNEQLSTVLNGNDATYNWLDVNPVTGDNFYRIRSIGNSGEIKYSQVVNVKIGKLSPVISVYPNPATGKVISVQLTGMEKGTYKLRLVNSSGQTVLTQQMLHTGGSAVQTIGLDNLANGNYYLEIIKPDQSKTVRSVSISD